VVALAAIALCAGIAAAATLQAPTDFTKYKLKASTDSGATFSGKIDSPESKCIGGRKVKAYRKHNGEKTGLGGDKTSGKGKFSIDIDESKLGDGKYFAKAKASSVEDGADLINCDKATSGSVKLS
jgi:hypothetical protein